MLFFIFINFRAVIGNNQLIWTKEQFEKQAYDYRYRDDADIVVFKVINRYTFLLLITW